LVAIQHMFILPLKMLWPDPNEISNMSATL
jgi:hypothetical protein